MKPQSSVHFLIQTSPTGVTELGFGGLLPLSPGPGSLLNTPATSYLDPLETTPSLAEWRLSVVESLGLLAVQLALVAIELAVADDFDFLTGFAREPKVPTCFE